jgi:hypothetical protein
MERAVRDYELAVYGTDEATGWGWKEYRPDLKGVRHRIAGSTTGYFGTLVVDGDNLTLLTEGEAYRPGHKVRGLGLRRVRTGS